MQQQNHQDMARDSWQTNEGSFGVGVDDDDSRTTATASRGRRQRSQITEDDIILGRGLIHAEKTGNARYYDLLDQYIPMYDSASSKGGKTKVVRSVYQVLQNRGARFLKKGKDGGYYAIDPKLAKKKISHAIRYRNRCQQDEDDDENDEENQDHDSPDNPNDTRRHVNDTNTHAAAAAAAAPSNDNDSESGPFPRPILPAPPMWSPQVGAASMSQERTAPAQPGPPPPPVGVVGVAYPQNLPSGFMPNFTLPMMQSLQQALSSSTPQDGFTFSQPPAPASTNMTGVEPPTAPISNQQPPLEVTMSQSLQQDFPLPTAQPHASNHMSRAQVPTTPSTFAPAPNDQPLEVLDTPLPDPLTLPRFHDPANNNQLTSAQPLVANDPLAPLPARTTTTTTTASSSMQEAPQAMNRSYHSQKSNRSESSGLFSSDELEMVLETDDDEPDDVFFDL